MVVPHPLTQARATEAKATPLWLAHRMLDLAGVTDDTGVLDPCAGTGTILFAARDRGADPEFIELNQQRYNYLREAGFAGRHGRMQDMTDGRYHDVVAMNPDFRDGRWAEMVCGGLDLTQDGCTLVTLVPTHFMRQTQPVMVHERFVYLLSAAKSYSVQNLPDNLFRIDDRLVPTSILVVRR